MPLEMHLLNIKKTKKNIYDKVTILNFEDPSSIEKVF